jgi:hypothetical protein
MIFMKHHLLGGPMLRTESLLIAALLLVVGCGPRRHCVKLEPDNEDKVCRYVDEWVELAYETGYRNGLDGVDDELNVCIAKSVIADYECQEKLKEGQDDRTK